VHESALRWLGVGAGLVVIVVVVAMAAGAVALSRAPALVKARIVTQMSNDLASEVELESVQTSLLPRPRVVLQGLVVRHRGRRDVPPLIQIGSLAINVSLTAWRSHRLDHVHIEGLRVFIPPRDDNDHPPTTKSPAVEWSIDRLTATDTILSLGVREPGVLPRDFHIHQLTMSDVGMNGAMAFRAALTNPRPAGEIESTGTFGPWHKDQPSLTPLRATYTFSHADLGTFKGLGGILTSEGSFGGVLERIAVTGSTTTPDFRLSISGNAIPLTTRFDAVVDGTNGNTVLKRVDATLGQTRIVVSGAVIGARDVDGHLITLDANIPDGRLDDVLRVAVKGKTPPLTGGITLKTNIRLPPGDRDVVDKLQLEGTFRMTAARFTSFDIQRKLNELSKRGRGKPDEPGGRNTVSAMAGSFTLKNDVMTLPKLTFGVPGAVIALAGRYNLRQETLDFSGTVRLQATVSQMVTGVKRVILKPIDPLFSRDGAGTVLPILIGGTRNAPAFKLDVRTALLRRNPS
jgi:hypothetical protein